MGKKTNERVNLARFNVNEYGDGRDFVLHLHVHAKLVIGPGQRKNVALKANDVIDVLVRE